MLGLDVTFIRAASSSALASACLILSRVEIVLDFADEEVLGRGRFAGGSSRCCEPPASSPRIRLAILSSLSCSILARSFKKLDIASACGNGVGTSECGFNGGSDFTALERCIDAAGTTNEGGATTTASAFDASSAT